MNVREYGSRVEDLTASMAKQYSEVLESAITQLKDIRNTHLRELEAITADFCGNAPPDTVAAAEMDQVHISQMGYQGYHPRHERH